MRKHHWLEDCRDIEKKHSAFVKAKGEVKIRGPHKNGHSVNDTAKELGISVGKVSENMRLAKGLKKHPEMSRIIERQDAIAFLRVKGEW